MRRTLRAAGLIVRNDLRRRLRNRSFLLMALVGPLVFSILISLAFGGGFGVEVSVGIVDADGSELAAEVRDGLIGATGEGVTFVAVAPDVEVAGWIEEQDASAAVVRIPAGFADALGQPDAVPLEVLSDPENVVGSAVAFSVATEVAARVHAGRLATVALLAEGRSAPDPAALAAVELPISIDRTNTDELSAVSLVGPGMALLFLFLSVGMVARSLIEERRQRVLDRIRAAPVSVTAILLGKAGGAIVLGLATLSVLWAATTVLLGAAWGDPVGVVVLVVASSLAVAGIAGVVAGLARTEQAADTYATGVAFVFGIVGGSMVPLSELPDGLRRLSFLTPNGWVLDAFAELSAGGGSASDVAPQVGVLLLWALVSGLVAVPLLSRRLRTR